MSPPVDSEMLRVARIEELRENGVVVVTGADRPIAVFYHDGRVFAVDNRCPHLGFPLHRGSVKDGILTCHWHEARFDLCSGCTFDLFADDVPSYETRVHEGVVYVERTPKHTEDREYHLRRLEHGLRHNISLIQGKALLGLRKAGAPWQDIVREVALYAARNDDDWRQGLTMLAVIANLLPSLSPETAYHAMLRASRQVAADCAAAVPHRKCDPLDDSEHAAEQLTRWMRHWVQNRQRDGAERVLLTAVSRFGSAPACASLVFAAATDRVYSETGHVFDAANKAFELLDAIEWSQADVVLPLILERMVQGRGSDEDAHWHHPVEVIAPLREVERRLPEIMRNGVHAGWREEAELLDILLGEDPLRVIVALESVLRAGAPPRELSKRVAYAAALRLARFGKTNEVGDWFNPRHTFIFANAVHQALKRSATPEIVRGIFHGALSVYMDRFLVVPPARLPESAELEKLPREGAALREQLLAALDRRGELDEAANLVARYIDLGHPVDALVDTLVFATVREDFDFHALQVLEAGVQQYREWAGRPEGRQILIGVARQLAAFCPTPRAGYQMATIAMRLERGEKMYEEATQ